MKTCLQDAIKDDQNYQNDKKKCGKKINERIGKQSPNSQKVSGIHMQRKLSSKQGLCL